MNTPLEGEGSRKLTVSTSARGRLHLGCGRYYLDGYTNVDYPSTEHTVQAGIKADLYCDIETLEYPPGSLEEVRLHHVFEHFPRPTALALVCRWRDWLRVGGMLRIETPDLAASAWHLVSPFSSYEAKQQVIRHLFGSHESHWAVHWDGWSADRFRRTLNRLGFEDVTFRYTKWGVLRNLDVSARKSEASYEVGTYETAVRELLKASLVTGPRPGPGQEIPDSEQDLLSVWMRNWSAAYQARNDKTRR